jgi:predicted amidophosphoribosyltransferase
VVLELLFPGRCLLCGGELSFNSRRGEPLCLGCRAGLQPLSGARRCAVCSLPLISEAELCTRCRRREFQFDNNLSLFEYQGAIRELLYQYKFRNRLRLAGVLAGFFADALRAGYPGVVLVPVPANPQAVARRGWDPVERICRILEREHGQAVCRALARSAGPSQKLLGYEERRRNLRLRLRRRSPLSAASPLFAARRSPLSAASPLFAASATASAAEPLLLDDVFTTGATASECARLLKQAGASQVRVLTLAIDVP